MPSYSCAHSCLESGFRCMCVSPSSPFVLLPPHAQACASNSHEPHQVGATLVQQGGLHCLGSGGSVSPPPPPRLSHDFARLDCPQKPRACVFAKIWLVWGCSRVCAGLGWTHGHAPGVPLWPMLVGFAFGLWRPVLVLFPFPLPLFSLWGGERERP